MSESKPFLSNRSDLLIDDEHVAGVKSFSLNAPNSTYSSQTTSGKSFYKDVSGKSVASASITKYGSVQDFQNILQNHILGSSLHSCEILSDQADGMRKSIKFENCAFDNFSFNILHNEISEISYELSSDEYQESTQNGVTLVENNIEEFLDNAYFEVNTSSEVLNLCESFSVSMTVNKVFARGLNYSSKKVWKNNLTCSINLRVNDIRKQIQNLPELIPKTDIVVDVYDSREKVTKVCTISMLECVQESYSEGYSDSNISAMDITYNYVDNFNKNAIVFI